MAIIKDMTRKLRKVGGYERRMFAGGGDKSSSGGKVSSGKGTGGGARVKGNVEVRGRGGQEKCGFGGGSAGGGAGGASVVGLYGNFGEGSALSEGSAPSEANLGSG